MDLKTIIEMQDDLYQKAEAVLEDTNLLNILSKFGSPEVIGSMALKVLTRRDIDIEVITDSPNREDVAKLVYELTRIAKNRIDFDITDHTIRDNQSLPLGFYIGMKYFGDLKYPERNARHPDVWTIDIWFVKQAEAQGRRKTNEIKEQLTPEKRTIVLEIKHALKENPNYHKKYGGIDIYDAVIKNNVTNLESFAKYLNTTGREL